MWLNIAYPKNGTLKPFNIDDDVLRKTNLFDHRLGQEVDGAMFGKEFTGYVFRLTGGSDKEGFPMVKGVLAASRVSLLLARGASGFNAFRGRSGERRRKNIRGCIVGPDIAMLNLVVIKKGEAPIPGLTDTDVPRRLGPKRASKIRKLFNLKKDDDVRRFRVRRKVEKAGKKIRFKAPKVQRLITPVIKARRLAKVKAIQASLRASQELRKEYLAALSRKRMVARQRKKSVAARAKKSSDQRAMISFAASKGATKGNKSVSKKK
jgi:small subunit ribosomal protein S6e